jgi:hypothetical protein
VTPDWSVLHDTAFRALSRRLASKSGVGPVGCDAGVAIAAMMDGNDVVTSGV